MVPLTLSHNRIVPLLTIGASSGNHYGNKNLTIICQGTFDTSRGQIILVKPVPNAPWGKWYHEQFKVLHQKASPGTAIFYCHSEVTEQVETAVSIFLRELFDKEISNSEILLHYSQVHIL